MGIRNFASSNETLRRLKTIIITMKNLMIVVMIGVFHHTSGQGLFSTTRRRLWIFSIPTAPTLVGVLILPSTTALKQLEIVEPVKVMVFVTSIFLQVVQTGLGLKLL